ncbi:ATP-binding protein [Desulfitobacterium chlororespirans]|uniref:Nuclease SbcCD subunit C n=1 Tax=Desulfitobacterium chlororespirans DSM 11544 TaxID=1121395 RepID=A0A1M7S0W9_9FIRM|nr:AAA family ATPase [Desulfitobacterium chlororespirans]SHN52086.1 exonuclease SbcC [Desulfitobacterium chlororespirans DSM 11544]
MLRIKALHIHMFRIYKDRKFTFITENEEVAPLVLITGGNGKGKTSIMDAVEWCFTGNIQHLYRPYDTRTKGDRQVAQSLGLLRYKDCGSNEETWVELTFEKDGKESTLRRSTLNNELGSTHTSLSITYAGDTLDAEAAQDWLKECFDSGDRPFADLFYKYFICNSQKAEEFRSKSRKDMTAEFEDFTLEHSEAKQVLVNLEQIRSQLNEEINDLSSKRVSEDKIIELEKEQQKLKEAGQIPAYVQRVSYPDERLDVDQLSQEEQEAQLQELIAGGYRAVADWLSELIRSRRKLMIKEQFAAYKAEIQQAIRKELYEPNTQRALEEKKKKIVEQLQKLNDQTLEQVGEFASGLENAELTPAEWQKRWGDYCSLNDIWRGTEASFEDSQKGDELLIAFSRLVGVRAQMVEYRKDYQKCPLCGAEEPFASAPAEHLALEAENYVKAHDVKKLTLEQQLKEEKQRWDDFRTLLNKDLREILKAAEARLSDELGLNQKILAVTESFFRLIAALELLPEQFADMDTLETYDGFVGIDTDSVQKQAEKINALLTFLGYPGVEQVDTEPQIVREAISPLAQKVPAMFVFDELDVRGKIVSLRLRKGNRLLVELSKDLEEKRNQNRTLDEQTREKMALQSLVKGRAEMLRKKLNQMKNDEVQGVAPYLFRIFSKLVKHSTLDGFQLQGNGARATETKLAFTDESKNPIMNLISDGQLGAFMISYLLGNAFLRRETGSFRCYFVDDITNSMDDINLVSFVDLIKYQLAKSRKGDEEVAAIQQFFFATCDGNLKRMFQYKMKGFEIPVALIDLDML